MQILLTNDDGIDAPGLRALADHLGSWATVTVVAPHRPRSAASHAFTLHKPLRAWEVSPGRWACSGTPADCVYFGLFRADQTPDLVISGINRGANLGQDVIYSGTVAGAREAVLHDVPGLAVSLHSNTGTFTHWKSAAAMAERVVRQGLPSRSLWNLNVPDVSLEQLRGLKATRLGHRSYAHLVDARTDPRGGTYFWIGGGPLGFQEGPEFDGASVRDGWASLTPLSLSMDDATQLEALRVWTDA